MTERVGDNNGVEVTDAQINTARAMRLRVLKLSKETQLKSGVEERMGSVKRATGLDMEKKSG